MLLDKSKIIIKVALISLLVVFASGCSLTKKSATTTTATVSNDFTNQDSAAVMAATKANLTKAKAAAATWHPDAFWVALNFNVPTDLNPKSLTQTFAFGSNSDSNYWFTYSIDTSEKFVRAVIFKSDFLGTDLQPFNESFWKISYAEALQSAYSNGGNAFMAEHPEAVVSLTLSQNQPKNWLWYVVTFQGANTAEKIHISANDGKIYNDQGVLAQ